MFRQFCENEEHQTVIMHIEVQWLSKVKSLIRVVELWDILVKLEDISTNGSNNRQKENASAKYIAAIEKEMKSKIFYLVDIFYHINLLNLYLQGRNANLLNCSEKIKSFINKLNLWAA